MHPFTQHFFIEGKLLGEAPRGLIRVHEVHAPPPSYLFYCGNCGDVFARCPVTVKIPQVVSWVNQWHSISKTCWKCRERCKYLSEWPGTLSCPWDKDFTASFPLTVLQREL